MDEIRSAFEQYFAVVSENLKGFRWESPKAHESRFIRSLSPIARDLFEKCESAPAWKKLAHVCAKVFHDKAGLMGMSRWSHHLPTWFRRRGIYREFLERGTADWVKASETLILDAQRTEDDVMYLALLEGVQFQRGDMKFGRFDLVAPSAGELETLLDVQTNRIFYPNSPTNTDRLCDHWYVRACAKEGRQELGWDEFMSPTVRPTYSELPAEAESALKAIVLCDWQVFDDPDFEGGDQWWGVRIPFVLRISPNPFERPRRRPPTEQLQYEPILDDVGDEVGEEPQVTWHFGLEQSEQFKKFLADQVARLDAVEFVGDQWRFLSRALGFLVKAFFSEGLDQLLWHVVTMESLLGEDREGFVKRMQKRVQLLYPTAAKKNKAAKAFDRVYNLRSELVHGVIEQGTIKDLRDARVLARITAVMMLQCLSKLADAMREGRLSATPSRTDVLDALDHVVQKRDLGLYPVARVIATIAQHS